MNSQIINMCVIILGPIVFTMLRPQGPSHLLQDLGFTKSLATSVTTKEIARDRKQSLRLQCTHAAVMGRDQEQDISENNDNKKQTAKEKRRAAKRETKKTLLIMQLIHERPMMGNEGITRATATS